MAVTVSLYNHTARRFAEGSFTTSNGYNVNLYTAATFDATHTAMSEVVGTQVANANGYTTGGATLQNVTVETVTTNDAKFTADEVSWTATGGPITASFGILYDSTDPLDEAPIAFIDFDGSQSAGDGTDFKIIWNASGIFTFTVT